MKKGTQEYEALSLAQKQMFDANQNILCWNTGKPKDNCNCKFCGSEGGVK